jgi:hypothetical protein
MKICRPRPQLVFTFDNRFSSTGCAEQQSVRYIIFRLQASYLSATSHTGRESCRVKSLYMKRFWARLKSVRALPPWYVHMYILYICLSESLPPIPPSCSVFAFPLINLASNNLGLPREHIFLLLLECISYSKSKGIEAWDDCLLIRSHIYQ